MTLEYDRKGPRFSLFISSLNTLKTWIRVDFFNGFYWTTEFNSEISNQKQYTHGNKYKDRSNYNEIF